MIQIIEDGFAEGLGVIDFALKIDPESALNSHLDRLHLPLEAEFQFAAYAGLIDDAKN